jgi:hypothetical protein
MGCNILFQRPEFKWWHPYVENGSQYFVGGFPSVVPLATFVQVFDFYGCIKHSMVTFFLCKTKWIKPPCLNKSRPQGFHDPICLYHIDAYPNFDCCITKEFKNWAHVPLPPQNGHMKVFPFGPFLYIVKV